MSIEMVRRFLVWLLLLPLFPIFLTAGPAGAGAGAGNQQSGEGDDDGDDSDDGDDEGDGEGDGDKTYTQADLDRILQRRLAREKKKLDKLEEYEKSHRELQELKKKQMSEAEKKQAEIDDLKKSVEAGQAALKARQEQLQERIIRQTVRSEAATMGFIDPDDAYLMADLSGVSIDEDTDEVDGVEKALKALAKAKPHLVKAEGAPDGQLGTPPRGGKRGRTKTEVPAPKIRL